MPIKPMPKNGKNLNNLALLNLKPAPKLKKKMLRMAVKRKDPTLKKNPLKKNPPMTGARIMDGVTLEVGVASDQPNNSHKNCI